MEKILAFCTIFLITIHFSLPEIVYNHGQQIDGHTHFKSKSFNYWDSDISGESKIINRKRMRRKTNDPNPNRMHYPDEIFLSNKVSTKNCSFGLCEEVENYPTDKIQNIISHSIDFQKYFADQPPTIDIFTRFGDEGENLCPTTTHTVFPKSAMNIHGVEQLLVNVGEFKQGVNFETCVGAGKSCKFSNVFPDGYTTLCQQKFTIRRLMALGNDLNQPIFDNFQMPSCCVCTIKKN